MQEQEIIALINSKGAFISEDSKGNAELMAYVDYKTEELSVMSTKIEWEISQKLSLEEISLEEASKLYEEGMLLSDKCKKYIEEKEKEVKKDREIDF